jgi:hypothetical protein
MALPKEEDADFPASGTALKATYKKRVTEKRKEKRNGTKQMKQ